MTCSSAPRWVALEPADLRRGDDAAEERVLPRSLDDPAPAGVAGDVDHRRERPVDADGPCLAGGDRLTPLDRRRVPGRRHRDRHRQDGAQPVDDVEPEQRGQPVPVALDGQPLQPVGLRGVGHEQQRADLAPRQRRLDRRGLPGGRQLRRRARVRVLQAPEVEVLGELTRLLLHGHRGEELINTGRDRRIRHRADATRAWRRWSTARRGPSWRPSRSVRAGTRRAPRAVRAA